MKSKKLISFLCAAAMTVSSFASLAVTASAEETTLWSDDFNKQSFGMIVDGTGTQAATENTIVPGLSFVTCNRSGGDRGVYVDTNGDTVYTGSYYAIEEKDDADKYLHMSLPMFGDMSSHTRYAHVDFAEAYTADATKDIVIDFDMKMVNGMIKGQTETDDTGADITAKTNPVIRFGAFDGTVNAISIDKKSAGIGDGWVNVKVVITNSGAKAYIEGTEVIAAAASNVKSVASIGLYTDNTITPPLDAGGDWLNADAPTKSPAVDVDNMVIYSTAAGEGAAAAAPAPASQTPGGAIKPMPTPYLAPVAPVLVAPAAAEEDSVKTYDFNSEGINKWYMGDEGTEITDVDGMSIALGGRSGGEATTFAQIAKNKDGRILELQAGKFGHSGRAPRVAMTTSMADQLAAGKTIAMSFAVMLSKPKGLESEAIPRLYLLKSSSQAGDDSAGAYNQVAAVLTSNIDEQIYRSDENSEVISKFTTEDEWHYVTFVISPTDEGATHRVYFDGGKDPVVKADYVGTGDTATYMEDLPLLTPESKAAKIDGSDVNPDYSLVRIDNLMIYYGEPEEPRDMCATVGEAPTPAPKVGHDVNIAYNASSKTATVSTEESEAFEAVLITANYDSTGALVAVKSTPISEVSAAKSAKVEGVDVKDGDKLMVWDSVEGMTPYGEKVISGTGQSQPTPTPTPTPTDTPKPSDTPKPDETVKPADTPKPGETVKPADTPKPGETVKPADTPKPGETAKPADTPKPDETAKPTVAPTLAPTDVPGSIYTLHADETKTISTAMVQTDFADANNTTAADVLPFSVADYGTGNAKVAAVPSLDGWGYKHFAYSGMMKDGAFQAGRQSNASMNKDENAVYANGVGNGGCDGAISFIPANNAAVAAKLPTTGTIVYTFDAIAYVGNAIARDRAMTFGLTSAADGTSVASVASMTIAIPSNTAKGTKITKKMVMTYSVDKKSYTISADGEIVAAGVAETPVTGIYALTDKNGSYHNAGIANLYITIAENDPVLTVTAPAEADGTLTADKTAVKNGDKVIVTATAAAGKKVAAVKANGTAITANAEGKYEVTISGDTVITAEYDRADIASIAITEGKATVSSGTAEAYTLVVKAADDTVLALKDGETVTWTVEGVDGTVITPDTKVNGTGLTGTLVSPEEQLAGKAKVKAAIAGKTAEKEITFTQEKVYTIAAAEVTGGKIEPALKEATAGTAVSVKLTPDKGYKYKTDSLKAEKAPVPSTEPSTAPSAEPSTSPASSTAPANASLMGLYEVTEPSAEPSTAPSAAPVSITETFTMPAYDVVVKAAFEKIDYTITNATAANANGTVTVANTANYNDEVAITVNPAEGYELDTLTVKDASNADITVTDGKFKMPDSNVTVTATFKVEVMSYAAILAHTSDLSYGGAGWADGAKAEGLDAATQFINNEGNNNWGGATFVQFTFDSITDTSAIVSVPFTFTLASSNGSNRIVKVYYVKDDNIDLTNTDLTKARYTNIQYVTETAKFNAAGTFTVDVTDAIKAKGSTGKLTLLLTAHAGGGSIVGAGATGDDAAKKPALGPITKGRAVTFNTSVTDKNFDVTIKQGDAVVKTVTMTNGTGSVFLPEGTYTYEVASQNDYKAVAAAELVVAKQPVSKDITFESMPKHDVTFTLTPATATLVVKRGETTVEPKTPGGLVYEFVEGAEYSYTATPATADANSYDPKNGTFTATADNAKTVTVALDAKTYSLKITGVPGVAKVYYSADDGAAYTAEPVAYTGYNGAMVFVGDGTAAPATAPAAGSETVAKSGIASGTNVKVKVVKTGYTDTEKAVTVNGADATVDFSDMKPTDTNTLFYESANWMGNNSMYGDVHYRVGSKPGQYGYLGQSTTTIKIGVPALTENEYKFEAPLIWFAASGGGKDMSHIFKDSTGKVLATLHMEEGAKNSYAVSAAAICVGEYNAENTEANKTVTIQLGETDGLVSITVNKTTGAVSITYNGQTATGTVEDAGLLDTIETSNSKSSRISYGSFKYSKVTE